jgi:hypothetical protein
MALQTDSCQGEHNDYYNPENIGFMFRGIRHGQL